MSMKFSGFIFDFNGVLFWDQEIQERAWCQFAEEAFGTTLNHEMMVIHVHGRNNQHTLEFLAGSKLADFQIAHLSARKESIYRGLCSALGGEFKLSPGSKGVLDELATRGIPRTIATASGKENLDFFYEKLRLENWFDRHLIVFDDGLRPGKPAPDIYLQAVRMIGLTPSRCVVVEDSLVGIQAAHAAGIGYVIALGESDQHAWLRSLQGVNQVVESLAHLDWEELVY